MQLKQKIKVQKSHIIPEIDTPKSKIQEIPKSEIPEMTDLSLTEIPEMDIQKMTHAHLPNIPPLSLPVPKMTDSQKILPLTPISVAGHHSSTISESTVTTKT